MARHAARTTDDSHSVERPGQVKIGPEDDFAVHRQEATCGGIVRTQPAGGQEVEDEHGLKFQGEFCLKVQEGFSLTSDAGTLCETRGRKRR